MIQEIHQSLEQLRSNLEQIENARSDYQTVGRQATDLMSNSQDLLTKHAELIQQLQNSSTNIELSQSDLVSVFRKGLEQSSAGLFDSHKTVVESLQTDFNTQSYALSKKVKESLDAYQKESAGILEKIDTSSKALSKDLDGINDAVDKTLTKTFVNVTSKNDTYLKALNKQNNAFKKSIELHVDKCQILLDEIGHLVTSLNTVDFSKKLDSVENSIKNVNHSVYEMQGSTNKSMVNLVRLHSELEGLIANHIKIFNEIGFFEKLGNIENSVKNINNTIYDTQGTVNKLTTKLVQGHSKLNNTISGINIGIQNTQSEISSLQSKVVQLTSDVKTYKAEQIQKTAIVDQKISQHTYLLFGIVVLQVIGIIVCFVMK